MSSEPIKRATNRVQVVITLTIDIDGNVDHDMVTDAATDQATVAGWVKDGTLEGVAVHAITPVLVTDMMATLIRDREAEAQD